jgi:hypothetical protein
MNKGFYITSNFDINVDSLDIEDSFEFRSEIDLQNFPDVLKIYKPISTEIGFYFINKLGGVIAFQFISENITEEKALEIYRNYSEPEDNYQYYEKLLKNIENTFGEKRIPFSISNLSINLFEEKVKWDYYRLNSDSIQYFVECSFIFQLTKSLHLNLLNSTPDFESTFDFEILLNQSKNVFCLESPRNFLVNETEIREYINYYESWHLSLSIKDLKERYKLSIINYNHYNNIKNNNSTVRINIFIISITTITLINLIPFLSEIWPESIDKKSLTKLILCLGSFILLLTIFKPVGNGIKNLKRKNYKMITKGFMKKNKI